MSRRVTAVPNEPGRYLVRSDSGGPPWLVDLFFDEAGPACGCWVDHNRTDKYRSCKHVKWAMEEHLEIEKWKLIDAEYRAKALKLSPYYREWPATFGPRPVPDVQNTTD